MREARLIIMIGLSLATIACVTLWVITQETDYILWIIALQVMRIDHGVNK